jgi:hypothetical protein
MTFGHGFTGKQKAVTLRQIYSSIASVGYAQMTIQFYPGGDVAAKPEAPSAKTGIEARDPASAGGAISEKMPARGLCPKKNGTHHDQGGRRFVGKRVRS